MNNAQTRVLANAIASLLYYATRDHLNGHIKAARVTEMQAVELQELLNTLASQTEGGK